MKKILIVEDEPSLTRILRSYLEKEGFSVITASRGDTGYDLSLTENPDLILLDLNLPGMDGMDVAREVNKQKNIPIIMVTARVEEIDKLKGLETGADDYISKPFSPREVVARVKAVLRRVEKTNPSKTKVQVLDITIDPDAHLVLRGDQELELTPSEFSLLKVMAENPGRVYSRFQLLEVIQGQAYEGYERTIDAHIKNLRIKLERDTRNPHYVKTVFGIGYRFAREDE
ncbi:MAG: OmpR family two-component response regulator [Chloroflexi bacterium]|nr:MAG: OmpR family two-component response regulator [Chloroflexota bacterium]MBA4376497.1 DNA-binding response regulator [Anaerolinea sp.]